MNRLLNRLTWIASFALGSLFTNLFNGVIGDSIYNFLYDSGLHTAYYWFLIIVFSLLSKRLFLSKRFVDEQIKGFEPSSIATVERTEPKIESKPLREQPETAVPPVSATEKEEALPDIKDWDNLPQLGPEPQVSAPAATFTKPEPALPPEPNLIQKFFSENLLAKVGGILLFLGVLFLLKLVYGAIGPVGKLTIGFAIGFAIYAIGLFLDKKKLVTESRVLIGTGILINYLVILSGRYLIGEGTFTDQMILNEGITFLLLIVNTVLAVVTSLLYRSHILLFFSFVVAFLNPFLIGADASSTPYTLVGYGLIVSLGALALSLTVKKDQNPFIEHLLTISFIGGNLLFLVAPFTDSFHWLIKLIATGLLTHFVIFAVYRLKKTTRLGYYFWGGYLFLIALLVYGQLELSVGFNTVAILSGYLLFLLLMLIAGVAAFIATSAYLVLASLALPLVIILGLAVSAALYPWDLVFISIGSLAFYLAVFSVISGRLVIRMQYLFFGIIGLFSLLSSILMQPLLYKAIEIGYPLDLYPITTAVAVVISAFMFQLASYYFSTRKDLQYLYSMGTGISILLLLTMIRREGDLMLLSIGCVVGFLVLNLISPFLNRSLLESRIRNLVLGLVAGVLFTAGELYYFGERYFSGLELGLAFLLQAVLYFALGYAMYVKLKSVSTEIARDVIYTLLGISISLFSLAIAFVFSKNSEVVSAVWLFEAGLLFFFYSKDKDLKLYTASVILMAIGIWKLVELTDRVDAGDFLSIVPLAVIFGALVAMLKFLEAEKRPLRWVHDILHLAGMSLLAMLLVIIIPSHGHGYSIIGGAIASLLLAMVYSRIYTHNLRQIFVGCWGIFFLFQILSQPQINNNLERDAVTFLIVFQYLSTILLGCGVYLFNRFFIRFDSEGKKLNLYTLQSLNAAFAIYLLAITTIYVFNFFDSNSFIVTIYWGLITFGFLSYGIQKDVIKWRTIGLYILILTVSKILFFDVWQQLDAAVYRILALMLVGGLMIVISILYQKKYEGNLLKELQPGNLQ